MLTLLMIVAPILGFGFLVFVHELGHFVPAKLCGVGVHTFSVGIGPVLWRRVWGKTEYRLELFPIGGYCGFVSGDEREKIPEKTLAQQIQRHPLLGEMLDDPARYYNKKSNAAKAAILLGGPLANFVAAFLILTTVLTVWGEREFASPVTVSAIKSESLAETNNLTAGMRLAQVGDAQVGDVQAVHAAINEFMRLGHADELSFIFEQDGRTHALSIAGSAFHGTTSVEHLLGVEFVAERHIHALPQALINSGHKCAEVAGLMSNGLIQLVTGQASPKALSGPVGMMGLVSKSAARGPQTLLSVLFILSIGIAVFNLVPLPPLDGGKLIFLLFRPLFSQRAVDRAEMVVGSAGVLLMLLMFVYTTGRDVANLFVGA